MKSFVRDLALILIGGAFVLVGKEAFAANELKPIAITCYAGSISNASITEGSMGAYDVFWRSVGAGTAFDGAAMLTDCVLSTQ